MFYPKLDLIEYVNLCDFKFQVFKVLKLKLEIQLITKLKMK